MDDPALDSAEHLQALRGLERINRISRSVPIVWEPIRALAREIGGRPVRVLDVATGAGDVPIGCARRAQRAGIHLQIEACDRSPRALEYARHQAGQARVEVRFFELNAIADSIPSGYDVVMCSLFLHHLEDADVVDLLQRMKEATRHLVVINDLVRSPAALLLVSLGTRLFSSSQVVHTDGPRSVRAAYTLEEIQAMADKAGLTGATVANRQPCRFLLVWRQA